MKRAKISNYLAGYLDVCADGPFTERLINICMHRSLPIWDIKRCGSNRIIFKTTPQAYKQLRTPAFRTRSHVRITKRCGVPFVFRRYSKRRVVICGAVILFMLLWYTSTHIMGITIYGNKLLNTDEVLSALENCGIKLGTKTSEIVPDSIRNRMMAELDELAWIGINANGSRVYIEVVERIQKDEGIEKDGVACNLVASKDGEIESITVREGQTLVNVGSGIRKGDVLVSGIVDNNINGFGYVKARGEVYAKTRYTKTRSYPLEYSEEVPTGERKKRYTVSVLNFKLPLFFGKNAPYETYSFTYEQKEFRPPIDSVPSLFVICEEYVCNRVEYKRRTPAQAIETGYAELIDEIKSELGDGVEIINQSTVHTLNEHGEVEVTAEVICRENIAEPVIIEKTLPEE